MLRSRGNSVHRFSFSLGLAHLTGVNLICEFERNNEWLLINSFYMLGDHQFSKKKTTTKNRRTGLQFYCRWRVLGIYGVQTSPWHVGRPSKDCQMSRYDSSTHQSLPSSYIQVDSFEYGAKESADKHIRINGILTFVWYQCCCQEMLAALRTSSKLDPQCICRYYLVWVDTYAPLNLIKLIFCHFATWGHFARNKPSEQKEQTLMSAWEYC